MTTRSEWERMSLKEKVEEIIERMDNNRFDCQGGYPSDYMFMGHKVVIASVDHDDAPDLTVCTLRDFVKDNHEIITDCFDEDEDA